MQAVGAIGKSGKAGEIDGSRREDDIAIALANGDSLRAYTCFLSLLLLTSSLSSSAETLGLETSLALPALFDFLKSYTCFCHVYSRVTREGGVGNSRVECERVREHSRVRAYKLTCHSLACVALPVILSHPCDHVSCNRHSVPLHCLLPIVHVLEHRATQRCCIPVVQSGVALVVKNIAAKRPSREGVPQSVEAQVMQRPRKHCARHLARGGGGGGDNLFAHLLFLGSLRP